MICITNINTYFIFFIAENIYKHSLVDKDEDDECSYNIEILDTAGYTVLVSKTRELKEKTNYAYAIQAQQNYIKNV